MHILIISSPDDAHIPFVTKHLPSSATYTIIDPFSAIGKNDIALAELLCTSQKSL